MVSTRPVVWVPLGFPAIHHLVETFVWKANRIQPENQGQRTPICGAEKTSMVYRKDGIYCRYCVAMEGIL